MSISLISIYNLAIGLFDDPSITQAYNNSPIDFFKIMYIYFKNGIPRFNNPLVMQSRLSLINNPEGEIEIFSGDGTTTYSLSTTPLLNSYFDYIIDGIKVNGTYDSLTNSVTFSIPIPEGKTGICEWYFAGEILPDSSNNELDITAQDILSRLLVLQWCLKEKNFLLDIRRLLNDTDFKLGSEANSIRAKGGWYSDMASEVATKINQYAWGLKFKKRFTSGGY